MSDPIRKPDEFPSRSESILSDTIGLEGYSIETPSRSRIEHLLIELKEIIGQGGGGSSTAYATSLEITMDEYFVMTATLKNKDGDTLGQVQTVDLPLESVVVNGSYDSINKNVVLTLENGNTVSFSVADLVDGLQTEITSQNPLDADLVDDSTATHKFATAAQLSQIQINKTALDNKADKSTTYTKTEVDTALGGKVDKETGKGLSTNDYTTDEKTKLAGIAEGAEVNVQANWIQTTPTADDFIKNKPTLGTAAALDVAASGNASTSQVVKGNDTRLTDPRNAADVSSWAKAANKPSYNGSEIALTGYTEAQSKSSVAETDTANAAIGKLEYRIETNENNISKDEAALVELVDSGAKNLWDFKNAIYSGKSADASYTKTDTDITVTSNGAWSAVTYKVNGLITGQRYVWSARISDYSVQSDTCRLRISSDVATQDHIASQKIEGNGNVNVEFVGRPELYFTYYINFSATSYQNTYKASENMICTKAAWGISQTYQSYRPSYQELTAKEQANESNISSIQNWVQYNCLDNTHPQDIDIDNSELTVYHNAFLKRVVISCKIKFLLQRTSASTALLIGSMGNIPNYTNIIPLNSVREFVSTSDYDAFIAKNATNYAIAFAVNSGTLAANTEIRAQFEYTYF